MITKLYGPMRTNSLNNIKNPNSDLMKRGIFRLRRPTKIHHCASTKKGSTQIVWQDKEKDVSPFQFHHTFLKFNYITWRNMDSKFQMLMKFKCQYGTRPMYNGNGNLQKEDDSNFIMLKYGGDSERNDRQLHQILEEMTEKVLMKSFF